MIKKKKKNKKTQKLSPNHSSVFLSQREKKSEQRRNGIYWNLEGADGRTGRCSTKTRVSVTDRNTHTCRADRRSGINGDGSLNCYQTHIFLCSSTVDEKTREIVNCQ